MPGDRRGPRRANRSAVGNPAGRASVPRSVRRTPHPPAPGSPRRRPGRRHRPSSGRHRGMCTTPGSTTVQVTEQRRVISLLERNRIGFGERDRLYTCSVAAASGSTVAACVAQRHVAARGGRGHVLGDQPRRAVLVADEVQHRRPSTRPPAGSGPDPPASTASRSTAAGSRRSARTATAPSMSRSSCPAMGERDRVVIDVHHPRLPGSPPARPRARCPRSGFRTPGPGTGRCPARTGTTPRGAGSPGCPG